MSCGGVRKRDARGVKAHVAANCTNLHKVAVVRGPEDERADSADGNVIGLSVIKTNAPVSHGGGRP